MTDLRIGIDASRRVRAQGKQIEHAFGQGPNDAGIAQREQAVHRRNGPATPVVQRDPGDKPLVEFIQEQGNHAKTAYDLLCAQVETAETQVRMLELYSGGVENEANVELTAAKARIEQTAAAVREKIASLPEGLFRVFSG